MTIFFLTLVSFTSWFVSTLTGGGTNLVLKSLIDSFLGSQAVAPVVTTGMMLYNSHKIFLFWQDIDWQVIKWYLPGAVAGTFLGAYVFTHTQLQALQILIGLFLVTRVFSSVFRKSENFFTVQSWYFLPELETTFTVYPWYFLPASFLSCFLSGLIGSTSLVLNRFYLNYGLTREQLTATKATNVFLVYVAKMALYATCGALSMQYLWYGLVIGIAAAPANWVGQLALRNMNDELFRQIIIAVTTSKGVLMLWEQRKFFELAGWEKYFICP